MAEPKLCPINHCQNKSSEFMCWAHWSALGEENQIYFYQLARRSGVRMGLLFAERESKGQR